MCQNASLSHSSSHDFKKNIVFFSNIQKSKSLPVSKLIHDACEYPTK